MAIRKIARDNGTFRYAVHFGEFYLGSFETLGDIINDWLGLLIRSSESIYIDKLNEFDELLQESLTTKSTFMDGTDKSTFMLFNLIWFFCYRAKGIPKKLIAKFVHRIDMNEISKVMDILRPHKREVPELDEIVIINKWENINPGLGKILTDFEKREYRKNLKDFKKYNLFYEETVNVVNMQLQSLNLKFEPTQVSKIESEVSELRNDVKILQNQLDNLQLIVDGKKPEYEK